MNYFTTIPSGVKLKTQDVIEIKLWEVYLLINRTEVYKKLIESSLDYGPMQKENERAGRLTFRFLASDWETVKQLLYDNRIPVVVQSNHLSAVKVKGRQPALV